MSNDISEKQLKRLVKQYADSVIAARLERQANINAFCNWLSMMGFGRIASAIQLGDWAWSKVKSIWKKVFG